MPVDASPGDFESALKPLWLRAQSGDDAAYRQCLVLLASRLRAYLKRRLSGSASGSSPGVRATTALSKEWVHHSDGRRQRINSKGHIESLDGV